MKKSLPWLLIGGLILAFSILIEISRPPELTWRDSFSRIEKIPFGSYLVYEALPELFPNQKLQTGNEHIFELSDRLSIEEVDTVNFIFVDKDFQMDEYEVSELLWQARSGNTIFLSAKTFGKAIMDSLQFKTMSDMEFDMDSIKVTLYGGAEKTRSSFTFPTFLDNEYFEEVDTASVQILGTNSKGKPNMIRQAVGDGVIYINLMPHAFTNYYMVDETNYGYIEHAFSFLPQQPVIWDEYYKEVRRSMPQTSLRFILSEQSLRYAYYLMWVSVLLFMVFQGRRIQRIIPVVKPLENTTLQFIDTVSRLYLQNGDHKNLAEKQVLHFKEHLRQQYGLNTNTITSDRIALLSRRSGISQKDLEATFSLIKRISSQESISEAELQQLNKEIENVYQINR